VIKAEISEADVVKVKPGQRVYFTILGEPSKQIDATLREVEPAPTSISSEGAAADSAVYYNGLFDVPNPGHKLRISMTAQVTIVLDEAQDVLTLSSGLLGRPGRDGDYLVQVYDPRTEVTEPRRIKVGLNNNINAEILDGLNEGDQVVSGVAVARQPGGGGGNFRGAGGLAGGAPVGGGFGGPRP
jgi:macrolide-specific efflux system membrane fusion protein